ncbi:MlaA family lipoprotein [Enterovibrio nigricans]|uniref:Phospholipid-binding lipoprotein MlaA n=1 Tax=Enterovibrio nigricans DSM 22720 TaxID=1121868 RepID=A0A1T4U7P1_9GAMM|nr:MlaA family lipoprotein [Enterovibrio nigricans]PKF51757.1 ABC transporter [Enterovibrio nigricans]SKA48656.1 phospholipid-binding lipoprotein MlaA [Enterovibrio nigricans DSM 22720]
MWKELVIAVGLVIGLSGCAQTPEETVDDAETNAELGIEHPSDPFEGFNREMWAINYDYLDPYIARPVSIAYVNYVPSFARTGISNFISNLEEPASVVNSLVMLEGEAALTHFNRFWINTVFGVAGLIDIASAADIQKLDERQFGDAMGYYDIGQGPYFMIPVYGPLTVREGVGDMVDDLYPPLSLLTLPQSILKWAFDGMESRAALVPQEAILDNSPDPYAFTRDAYLQNKAFRAQGSDAVIEDDHDEDEFDDALLDEIDDY